ncbi:hypothetical protein MKW94_011600, partial [Papaver nudicaule]|nr:hypothetical protein [Papaver nudicaule]
LIEVAIQIHQQVTPLSQVLPGAPEENLVDVPIQEEILVDVPVMLQTFGVRSSNTVLGRRPEEADERLFDVLIQEDFTVDVLVSSQTCGVPSSSTILGKRTREEDNDILRAPLVTFDASTLTSSTRIKPRTSRRRRGRFTPLTLLKSPEIRAQLRAFNAARIRAFRNQYRSIEPVLRLTASDPLRQRKSRASCTIV